MKKIIISIVFISILIPAFLSAQTAEGEYYPFMTAKGEDGAFLAINSCGASVLVYLPWDNLGETRNPGSIGFKTGGQIFDFTFTHTRYFLPKRTAGMTDAAILKTHADWESSYQVEMSKGQFELAESEPLNIGGRVCHMVNLKYTTQDASQLMFTFVSGNGSLGTIRFFVMPRENNSEFQITTISEAKDFVKKIFENMVIFKDPVPFRILGDALQYENSDWKKLKKEYK